MSLSLDDLDPQPSKFKLKSHPGKEFTLCAFSLRVRIWATRRWGIEEMQLIFKHADKRFEEISELAYFMLKEKEAFGSIDDFLDAILTAQDQIQLLTAVVRSIGVAEPKLEELKKELEVQADLPPALSPSQPVM